MLIIRQWMIFRTYHHDYDWDFSAWHCQHLSTVKTFEANPVKNYHQFAKYFQAMPCKFHQFGEYFWAIPCKHVPSVFSIIMNQANIYAQTLQCSVSLSEFHFIKENLTQIFFNWSSCMYDPKAVTVTINHHLAKRSACNNVTNVCHSIHCCLLGSH